MSDAAGRGPEKEKRVTKHTAKGLEMFVEKCQKTRSIKCKQAKKLMETLKELSKSKENATEVQSNLRELIKLCDEAKESHESLVKLPLPEDELEKQNQWFQPNMETLDGFIKDVHVWLTDVGQQIKHTMVESENITQSSDVNADEIGPDDSVSNVSKPNLKPKSSLLLHHHLHLQHPLLALKLRQKKLLSWNGLRP